MSAERVAPPQLNYDDILPLAIESRSNRREFLPVNGQTFSNAAGSTICRIDVNADSMLDASHSYLECDITNSGGANTHLSLNPFCPSWIGRLRIESGGVVIEDINEYSRLYAMLVLNQCPADYVKNNLANQGLYKPEISSHLRWNTLATSAQVSFEGYAGTVTANAGEASVLACGGVPSELHYPMSANALLLGMRTDLASGTNVANALNQPVAVGLTNIHAQNRIINGGSHKMCFPLVSGFLNMEQYIPLIMMNAGFTIELTLCDANRIGVTQTETAGAAQGAFLQSQVWSVSGIKYVSHLIDLDRSFYDRLRSVMEQSAGVLQLAGQTYRHFVGQMPVAEGPHTITLPARVKSVKSIFGTFIDSDQMGDPDNYDSSVFQNAFLKEYRFEIGSIRYPQTSVNCDFNFKRGTENQVELQKAWGKLGDYGHQQAYTYKNTMNSEQHRDGQDAEKSVLSAFFIGYDFESFQRVALEAGINTADRSLPINCILERTTASTNPTRVDFYVLTDALYYINLDGTVSVSV